MSLNGSLQAQLSKVHGKIAQSPVTEVTNTHGKTAKVSAVEVTTPEKKKKPRHIPAKKPHRPPERSAMEWKADGEDHINISAEAVTQIGKRLNRGSKSQFTHSHFGSFKTIEGFTTYIQSEEKDDRLRRLWGNSLKEFSKLLTIKKATIRNFKAVVIDTYYQRIVQEPALVKLLVNSDLPFDVYYTLRDTGVRVRPASYGWMIPGLNEIRRALKESAQPDFSFLMDDKKQDIYHFLLKSMNVKKPEQETKE